jgi:hypothetical protein
LNNQMALSGSTFGIAVTISLRNSAISRDFLLYCSLYLSESN